MTGPVTASGRDLHALAGVIRADRGEPSEEGVAPSLLSDLLGLVRCDHLLFIGSDSSRQVSWVAQVAPAEVSDWFDPAAGWKHYWSSPASYPDRSGDLLSITTISDFYTRRQFHNTGMYADYLGPGGVEAEVMVCLSAPPGCSRRLVFFRGHGPDFDGRDRLLLALLRPHLNEAYQELSRRRRAVPGLTSRQWELLRLLASGHSNAEIARELVVSTHTIRKHLENIFARLGVTSRTAAVAKAFPSPPY